MCEPLAYWWIHFTKEGMLVEAKEVFEVMIQRGIDPAKFTYNSLIDGCCLQSQMDEAVKTYDG